MDYIFTTVGLIPFFINRAFAPIFITALVCRIGPEWGFLSELTGIPLLAEGVPAWAISTPVLIVLALAAFVEFAFNHNPELREAIAVTDVQLKALMATVLCLMIAPASTAEGPVAQATASIGGGLNYTWAIFVGAAVWFFAGSRKLIYEFLADVDEDDDLRLQAFLTWSEDLLGPIGIMVLIVFPAFMAVMAILGILVLYLIQKTLTVLEQRKRVPCNCCGELLIPCGMSCPSCETAIAAPKAVGALGIIKSAAAPELSRHAINLKMTKRCSRCGERVKGRGVTARCSRCDAPVFVSKEQVELYLNYVSRSLPKTLGVLAIISSVPILGIFFGVLYYRITFVSTLRQYCPIHGKIGACWFLRFCGILLVMLQWIPILGSVYLPLMCFLNYKVYLRLVRSAARSKLPAQSDIPSHGCPVVTTTNSVV